MALDYPFNVTFSTKLTNESDSGISPPGSATVDHPGVPGILAGVLFPHIICSIVIGMRAWCRLGLMKKWYTDDTLITLGWASSTVVCIIYSVAAVTPRIRNAVVSTNNPMLLDIEAYLMRQYLGLIFYQICLCLTKLSIAACYVRMFVDRPRERKLAWGTILWIIVYGLPLLFVSIFQCHPAPGLFFGVPLQCFSFNNLLITSASLHAVTDIWLVAMIIPCVRSLELPSRQKVALSVVLSCSVFVVVAGMVRLQLSLAQQFKPTSEQVANTMAFFVLTILECDIALICATAPTLRLLFVEYCPRLVGENGLVHRPRRWTTGGANFNPFSGLYHRHWPSEPRSGWIGSSATRTRASQRSFPDVAAPTMPAPILATSHWAPTTLSLRGMLASAVAKGKTIAAGEDRNGRRTLAAMQPEQWDHRSSAGFEGHRASYYEQYLNYHAHMHPTPWASQRTSRTSDIMGQAQGFLERRWATSQESFVMGENDPASPSRLSPVSCVREQPYGTTDNNNTVVDGMGRREHGN